MPAKSKKQAVAKKSQPLSAGPPKARNQSDEKSPGFDTAQLRKTQDDPGTALLKKTASESETEFLRKPASESDTAFIKKPDGVPAPERERGSYDGDTAIKLYLR